MGWGRAGRKEADKEVRYTAVKPDSSAETARLFPARSDPSAAVSPDNLIAGVTRTGLAKKKKKKGAFPGLSWASLPFLSFRAWRGSRENPGVEPRARLVPPGAAAAAGANLGGQKEKETESKERSEP